MPHKDPEARKAYLRDYAQRNPAYERVKKWREQNPEKRAEQDTRYVQTHREQVRVKQQRSHLKNIDVRRERDRAAKAAFRAANPELVAQRKARYAKDNPGVVNACVARRKAAQLQRTPKWLTEDDLWMISQAYDIAALRTKMFGFAWHVDHILPLQGERVSGLHVPCNLQVIPGVDNCRKGNRV